MKKVHQIVKIISQVMNWSKKDLIFSSSKMSMIRDLGLTKSNARVVDIQTQTVKLTGFVRSSH